MIHQVKNGHFSEHVEAIRVEEMKLIVGKPGDSRTLKWPALAATPTPFGGSGGSTRQGSQCLAGINTADKTEGPHCHPGCLYNITADPAEQHDLIADPRYATTVAALQRKLRAAGEAAPPPSSYWQDPAPGLAQICELEVKTGFLEPLVA